MGNPPLAIPTLPAVPIGEPRALVAGLTFLEGAPTWDLTGLREWFEQQVFEEGCMSPIAVVTEHPAGYVALRPNASSLPIATASLPKVLETARSRVVSALRGLLARPLDDRFLAAAIFTGRVRRRAISGANRWVARPEPNAPLSGIVLSLFAVDILSNRELYERELCVCDTCGRVSFNPDPTMRRACREHAPQKDHRPATPRDSGYTLRVNVPTKPPSKP